MSGRRANIIGPGLIGGSVGLALRARGWLVSGDDANPDHLDAAIEHGAIDKVGLEPDAEITFVCTPASSVAAEAQRALDLTTGIVTDVGSVKASICAGVRHPRFVGGHPMAGSEQDGVKAAWSDMFSGAVWVLTPTEETADSTYTETRRIVREFGADVVSMKPEDHDTVVALVSHVPHLTAATLMRQAASSSEQHQVLLRMAAGGFRDMTRIASGHPNIWPDICAENSVAITAALDELIYSLSRVREIVARSDRAALLDMLSDARAARVSLPTGLPEGVELAEVRVVISDKPGQLARLMTLAPEVNIYDFEIAHSTEGREGVGIMVVERSSLSGFLEKLGDAGYSVSFRQLS